MKLLIMDTRAAVMLKQTFLTILSIRHTIMKLLQRPQQSDIDLESQMLLPQKTFEDDPINENEAVRISNDYCPESGHAEERTPYAEGPSRVFLYSDGISKDCLALFISEDIVSKIQEVTDDKRILKNYEKIHGEISKSVFNAKIAIERLEDNLVRAESEHQVQELQKELECNRLKLQDLAEEKDALADRLRIFRINLDFSRNATQNLFEQILGDAKLLEEPENDQPDIPCGADRSSNSIPRSQRSDLDDSKSSNLDPEELLRKAAKEKLLNCTEELQEIQEKFDTWPEVVEQQSEIYENDLANGEQVPTRSEFDLEMLRESMRITSYLVKVEKEREQAREHAIALGAVDEDWGKPRYEYMNDPWEAESCTSGEMIAYIKTRSWSRVERWVQSVSNALDGSSTHNHAPEPTDLDEWDAEPINVGEGCVSAVAYDPVERENIRGWQMIEEVAHERFKALSC